MTKNQTNRVMLFLLLMVAGLSSGLYAFETETEQPTKSERFEQIENDSVRTWRSVIVVDQPLKLHRHDYPRVVTALKDGVLERTLASGEVISTHHWKAGESYWLEADPEDELHYCVNAGTESLEVVVTEIK